MYFVLLRRTRRLGCLPGGDPLVRCQRIVLQTHAIQSVGHPRQLVFVPCRKRLLLVRDAHAPLAEELGAHINSLMNATGHLIGYEA